MPNSQDGPIQVSSHRRIEVTTLPSSHFRGAVQSQTDALRYSQWTFWADLGRVNRALIRVLFHRFWEFLQERWLSPMTCNLGWLLCCERNKRRWNEYIVRILYFIIYLQRHTV